MERDCKGAELQQQAVVLVRAGMKTICNERQLIRGRGSMQIQLPVWGVIYNKHWRCESAACLMPYKVWDTLGL